MFKLLFRSFVLGFLITVCRSGRTDKTLVDKTVGKDVVEAVDYLIRKSAIFPDDHRFLVRMAFVATQFGGDSDTFTAKANIWGLSQTLFDKTKDTTTYPILTANYTKIKQNFNIDWNSVKYTDLSKPIFGGLAVSIFFALNAEPVPILLEDQGTYYNKYFSSATTSQQFYDKVKNMEKLGKCFGRMDLAILLDGSGSIGTDNFDLAKSFVSSLVSTFSLTNVNLGLIIFSNNSTVIIPVDNNLSMADIKNQIAAISYPGGGTDTSGAIMTAKDMLLRAKHRDGSPRIMAIFTDGQPNSEPTTEMAAKEAIKSNITLFAVGIGAGINSVQLAAMVLNQTDHVFSLSSYKSLSESFELMNSETCKISQKPILGKKINDTLIQNEKRFFCYDLPQIGITVTIEVQTGKTDSYYSYTLQNPSSALNDGIINGKTFIPTLQSTIRVCVTVEGLEIKNNFVINSEEGNKSLPSSPTPQTTTESDDSLIRIREKAKKIAEDAFNNLKDYNQISNQVCNQMSLSYSKYEWICIVGEKVEISEHQLQEMQMFQFGFKVGVTDFYFVINIP